MNIVCYVLNVARFPILLVLAALAAGCRTDRAEGPDRVPTGDVAARFDLPPPAATPSNLLVRSPRTTLIFERDSRKLLFNGVTVLLNGPASCSRGKWSLSDTDVATVIEPLLTPGLAATPATAPVVMIDPGHGGADAGATGRLGMPEKTIVLDVGLRLASKLCRAGVCAVMTRDADTTVSLPGRVERARAARADLFVSLHANFATNPQAAGIETYVMPAPGFPSSADVTGRSEPPYPGNRNDAANTLLGYHLHEQALISTEAADRGLRRARFYVLRYVSCPAVLLECGFLSNAQEEARLVNPLHQEFLAEGLFRGLLAALNRPVPVGERALDPAAALPAGAAGVQPAAAPSRAATASVLLSPTPAEGVER